MKKITAICLALFLLLTSAETIFGCSIPLGFANTNANVREKPDINANKICLLNKGYDFEIVDVENGWYEILINGSQHGFIYGELVNTEIDYYSLDKISKFSTSLDLKKNNRMVNIGYAAKMTNIKVEPNQEFNFNDLCNTPNDWVNMVSADVASNGKLVQGIGGGICQVSTNIYNAIKPLKLKIIERQPHSIKVSYVSEGNDAAVSQGSKNFIFKNTLDYPIYINTYVDYKNSKLITKIYK